MSDSSGDDPLFDVFMVLIVGALVVAGHVA
jgi:hypothetical protein